MKLETGYNNSFNIRYRDCLADINNEFTILYLSDLHFNKYSGKQALSIINTVNSLSPDIILLGGDYADSQNGLLHFQTVLKSFASRKNIFAVAGNHDYFFGIDKIKNIVTSCGIAWIEKSSCIVEIKGTVIQLDGNILTGCKAASFSIACLHKPLNVEPFKAQYNLAFAGHLHGGQLVLWQQGIALYPGRLFYKWNILEKDFGDCLYLISKGMGDTMPVRFNCQKEMIFVTVKNFLKFK